MNGTKTCIIVHFSRTSLSEEICDVDVRAPAYCVATLSSIIAESIGIASGNATASQARSYASTWGEIV
jgi:hypothetical protein